MRLSFLKKQEVRPLVGLTFSVKGTDGFTTKQMVVVSQELMALGAKPEHQSEADLIIDGSLSMYRAVASLRDRFGNTLWFCSDATSERQIRKEVRSVAVTLEKSQYGSIKPPLML